MRVFNKKLNRLLAIMLASVMGATSLPATPVVLIHPLQSMIYLTTQPRMIYLTVKFQMNRIRIIMPPRKNSHSS